MSGVWVLVYEVHRMFKWHNLQVYAQSQYSDVARLAFPEYWGQMRKLTAYSSYFSHNHPEGSSSLCIRLKWKDISLWCNLRVLILKEPILGVSLLDTVILYNHQGVFKCSCILMLEKDSPVKDSPFTNLKHSFCALFVEMFTDSWICVAVDTWKCNKTTMKLETCCLNIVLPSCQMRGLYFGIFVEWHGQFQKYVNSTL